MRTIDDIKYICDDRFTTKNRMIAKEIVESFSNDSVPLVMATYKLTNLKENIIYGSTKQDDFFNKLKSNNYNGNFEILTLVYNLFAKKKVDKEQIIDKYINSPYIDSINYCDKHLEIATELGDYEMNSIDNYLKSLNINSSFLNKLLIKECHKNVKLLLNYHSNLYAITSFCKPMFSNGSYYHSYCLDKENNKIIDPSYRIVMDKKDYEKLFETEEIFKIKGYNLNKAFDIARRHKVELGFYHEEIASTWFQQYIWENTLPSPNEEIYSKIPSNKHLLIKNRGN